MKTTIIAAFYFFLAAILFSLSVLFVIASVHGNDIFNIWVNGVLAILTSIASGLLCFHASEFLKG